MVSPTMSLLFLSLVVVFLLFLQAFAEASVNNGVMNSLTRMNEGGDGTALYKKYHHHKINCHFACSRRCRKASRKNVCTRACGTCCMRCKCVPPGTYGNTSVCPCYASLTTHGHKLKCP
ncbi:gibberellin-regulated protein 9-like isoform X3 [Telopea speciosissima]|uniref:gibberellin-regulated protein 9-like isoform X3 n=1 Tax=Telopea speciosissima TaxID=54955 RepID=UPI001CC477FC|nr:gibberellin-regulated protein 9-like isoform X3 [Telopea speciosissima]